MGFRVDGIDHVEVFVADIEASIRWYAETLGLVEVARWDPEPVMVGAGETKLALFRARSGRASGRAAKRAEGHASETGWHRVAWRTDGDGFERVQKHLSALGIEFRGPIDHGTARSIYFEDPDGNRLEVTCYE